VNEEKKDLGGGQYRSDLALPSGKKNKTDREGAFSPTFGKGGSAMGAPDGESGEPRELLRLFFLTREKGEVAPSQSNYDAIRRSSGGEVLRGETHSLYLRVERKV